MSTRSNRKHIHLRGVFFLGILLLAALLRIYRLPQNFVFGVDEEYQAYLAQTIIKNFHIIWVGVSSTADFYLGPAWTYLTAGLLYLSKGDPIIGGYFAAFLGVLTTLAVFFVGSRLFSWRCGILASGLYASLPLIVFFDQKYWNVSLVPLLSLVLFFCVAAAVKNQVWWLVFAFAYGLVFHSHLSLAPVGILALILLIRQRKKIRLITYLFSLLIFLAVTSPLIVFDYFHKWSNLTVPLRLFSQRQESFTRIDLGQKVVGLRQSLGRLVYLASYRPSADETNWGCAGYCQTKPPLILSAFLLLVLILFLLKDTGLLRWVILTYLASFFLFPGATLEYYLLGVFPLLLFIPGILMEKANPVGKKLIIGVLLALSLLGIRTVVTATGDFGLGVKKELVNEVVAVVGQEPFELQSEGKCHIAEGWRYLFGLYGRKPARSSTDQIFSWLYPEEIGQEKAKYLVIMSEKRVLSDFPAAATTTLEKGGFRADIYRQ